MYIQDATIKNAEVFEKVAGFEWDHGNKGKNWSKHKVRDEECEELFFDHDKKVLKDVSHSGGEKRYILIGKTKKQRLLFAVFTTRKDKVRIISCRDLNKKEYKYYEERI